MNGLYGLLAMAVYVVAILGIVMVRDQGLAHRFEEELGVGTRERQSLADILERRLGPAGEPLVRRIQLDNPARREKLRQRIDAAGRPGGLTVERYARRKGAFLVLGVGLALFALVSGSWLSALALLFLGTFAFDALRQRNTSVGVGTFVTAVQQAEELGVPLTDALVDLARDMRQAAFQRARQRAQKATPRVSIVTTAVIAPGAVIIIVASLFANLDLSTLK